MKHFTNIKKQITDTRNKLTRESINEAKQKLEQLGIKQFSKDMLEFNRIMKNAVKDSKDIVMDDKAKQLKDEVDKILVQEAKLLQEKYPVERYEREFIDKQLKVRRDGWEKKFDIVRGVTIGITYTIGIGGPVALMWGEVPYWVIPIGMISGGFLATPIGSGEDRVFDWVKDFVVDKNEWKWLGVWDIFNTVTNFKNADDLRKPVKIRTWWNESSSGSTLQISSANATTTFQNPVDYGLPYGNPANPNLPGQMKSPEPR